MQLNMLIIGKLMEAYQPTLQINTKTELYLKGVRLWDGDAEANPDCVYVTTDSCLLSCVIPDGLRNVICLGANDYVLHIFEQRGNIIGINAQIPLLELFDVVAEIFDSFAQYEKRLLDAVLQRKPIREVLEIVANMFKNPVFLFDDSFMLIAAVDSVGGKHLTNQNWLRVIREGHAGDAALQTISYRMKNGSSSRSERKAAFESVNPTVYSSVGVNLFDKNNIRIARLVISEEFCKLNGGFLGLADFVSPYLTIAYGEFYQNGLPGHSSLEKFFSHILSGATVTDGFIKNYLNTLSWGIDDSYLCCVIPLSKVESAAELYNFQATQVKQLFGNCFYLPYNNMQAFIVDLTRSPLTDDMIGQLRRICTKRSTCAGISMEHRGLHMIGSQFTLACAAARLGRKLAPDETVYFYKDYFEYHITDLQERPHNLRAMCYPKLLELYEMDPGNWAANIETLYTYLYNERSLVRSAAQMHIHRNSFVYRLDKIKELWDIDFDDPHLRLHVLLSCLILRVTYVDDITARS